VNSKEHRYIDQAKDAVKLEPKGMWLSYLSAT